MHGLAYRRRQAKRAKMRALWKIRTLWGWRDESVPVGANSG